LIITLKGWLSITLKDGYAGVFLDCCQPTPTTQIHPVHFATIKSHCPTILPFSIILIGSI